MHTATYSPDDNKLRLYPASRLSESEYARVKTAGFRWAPKQELFVAPAWSPDREALLFEMCGEIGDEDTSLVERAEERAERFEEYRDSRFQDAENARQAVAAAADGIPLGQPILVGHHSEARARKEAEKIENGMRRAVRLWETSRYWEQRAAGAIRHAKYKELPAVRARRIKKLEAELRHFQAHCDRAQTALKLWSAPDITEERAKVLVCSGFLGFQLYWDVTNGKVTTEEAQRHAISRCQQQIDWNTAYMRHTELRLAYERAMLADQGGTVADRNAPRVGGGCKCWAARHGYLWIKKVNKVSVTILDNWGNGGANFTRTIAFDKLTAIVSPEEVEAARAEGRLVEREDKCGFAILPPRESQPVTDEEPRHGIATHAPAPDFERLRDALADGVQTVSAPTLFPTPAGIARRMVDLAEIQPEHRVLEPSAGTGNILREIGDKPNKVAVEVNSGVVTMLMRAAPSGTRIHEGDFLECTVEDLGLFDRVVMNPPFNGGADIKHIEHAMGFVKPGGRIVAICANGPRQIQHLKPRASQWIDLPTGTFEGTGVRAAIAVFAL